MQIIDQLKSKIRLIVARAVIDAVKSSSGDNGLTADISLAGGEEHTDVPLMQHYGISAKPSKDTEAVVLFIGGARDNGIVVATQGGVSSLPDLEDGEVALYSEYGQTIILKSDGSIVATPKSGQPYRIDADLNVTGKVTALCDTASVSLTTHTHPTPVGLSSSPTPKS